MNVITNYPLPPGACWFCNTPRPGNVIDTLRDVEAGRQDHRVYLCAVCVTDMFSQVTGEHDGMMRHPGVVPIDRFEAVARLNDELSADNEELRNTLLVHLPALEKLIPLIRPPETEPPGAMPVPQQPKQPKKPAAA